MTITWEPKAARTTQKSVYDITNTAVGLQCTINDITISTPVTCADRDAAIDAMVLLWNAQTSPYFSTITASVDNSTATQLILTADTAGVPFVVLVEEYIAAYGTVSASATESIAADGPEFYDNVNNWDTGALPASNDDVIFRETNISCCWNLPTTPVDIDTLTTHASFTGVIGLNPFAFATSADGKTTDRTVVEYRQNNLHHEIDETLIIGIGNGIGSGRIRIQSDDAETTVIVYNTAGSPIDSGRWACEIKTPNTGTKKDYSIFDTPGGLLLDGCDINNLYVSANNSNSYIDVDNGTYIENAYNRGNGSIYFKSNTGGSVNGFVDIEKGQIYLDGIVALAVLKIRGGTIYARSETLAIDYLYLYGGIFDLRERGKPPTIMDCHFYASDTEYQIKSDALGMFAPAASTFYNDIDWEFSA